jgi:hypothetical protein
MTDALTITTTEQSILDLLRAQIWFVAVDADKVLGYVDGMIDTARRRHEQAGDDYDLSFWNVTQWRPKTDPRCQRYPRHDHRMVCDALALEGVLEPHPENNGRLSRFRLSGSGLSYAEACADRHWRRTDYYRWMRRDFEALAANMLARGYYLLPEPTRGWWTGRIAFEYGGEGRQRELYSYRPNGRLGRAWLRHEEGRHPGYFYNSGALFKLDDLAGTSLPDIPF